MTNGIKVVVRCGSVSKIFDVIIGRHSIPVAHHLPFGAWPNEGFGYKSVNIEITRRVRCPESCSQVSMWMYRTRHQSLGNRHGCTIAPHDNPRQRLQSPDVRYLIEALIFRDITPLFAHDTSQPGMTVVGIPRLSHSSMILLCQSGSHKASSSNEQSFLMMLARRVASTTLLVVYPCRGTT